MFDIAPWIDKERAAFATLACINKLDMGNITQRYKCHTGWENRINKGNFRQNNIYYIREFPCALINEL